MKFRLIRNAFVVNVAKVYLCITIHTPVSRTRSYMRNVVTPFAQCSLFLFKLARVRFRRSVFTCLSRLVGETPGTSMWISMKTCQRGGDRSPSVFAINSLCSSSVSRKQVGQCSRHPCVSLRRCRIFHCARTRSRHEEDNDQITTASNFCDELPQVEEHRD